MRELIKKNEWIQILSVSDRSVFTYKYEEFLCNIVDKIFDPSVQWEVRCKIRVYDRIRNLWIVASVMKFKIIAVNQWNLR